MNSTINRAVDQYEADGRTALDFLRDAVEQLDLKPKSKTGHKGIESLLTDFAITVEIDVRGELDQLAENNNY